MERMEPEVKRIKMSNETHKEGSQVQIKVDTNLTSIQKLQKIANDYQEKYLSSTKQTSQKGQSGNDKDDFIVKDSSASATGNAPDLSSISVTQHGVMSTADKSDLLNDKKSQVAKTEQKISIQNGSGQKLESIIGRLSSDKVITAVVDSDEDALICKADASTQTFPDFVKIVKCLVIRRMKQLEQSLIGGAVTDSVLNGKLIDLQRENRELRKNARKLQEKLDLIIQSLKLDENSTPARVKEILESAQNQQAIDIPSDSSSPVRKQAAVVSPYHVQNGQGEGQALGSKSREIVGRSRKEVMEITGSHFKLPSTVIVVNENVGNQMPLAVQSNPATRQGPQVKYVPQRFHQMPHPSGAPPSQFINLAQGGVVMQKLPMQRPRGMEYVTRPQSGPVIYTTQSVQVTGPRMSTIPPQPQQANQHGNQRPIVSPSSIGARLTQPGQLARPGGNMLRLQGSSPQTVHYIPQNVVPYMAQIPQNVPFSGHRIVTQGPPSELRQHLPAPQHNVVHGELQQLRPTTSLPPPPPYQIQRGQNDQSPKVNANQIGRMQNEQPLPPKLQVNITVSGNGIVLSWDFESEPAVKVPVIECYHLFASQDSPSPPTLKSEWKKIGVVKALPLPMACTLTQFVSGNSYHFAVLAVDVNGREGPMSNSCTVRLNN